jgi:hypothetical protein
MLSISVLSLVVNFATVVSLHLKIKVCVLFESKNYGDNNIQDGTTCYQSQGDFIFHFAFSIIIF